MSPAAPGRRLAAFVVDQLAGLLVFVAALAATSALGSSSAGVDGGSMLLAGVGVPLACVALFGIAQLVWEGVAGLTVGNVALRVRTIAVGSGGAPGVGRALLRRIVETLGGVVVFGTYVVVISPAWDRGPARQGWQDKVAGTTMVSGGDRAVATTTVDPPAAPTAATTSAPAIPPLGSGTLAVSGGPVPNPAPPTTPAPEVPTYAVPPSTPAPSAPGLAPPPRAHTDSGGPRGGVISEVPGFGAAEPAETAAPIEAPTSAPAAGTPIAAPAAPVPAVLGAVADDEDLDHTRLRGAPETPSPRAAAYRLVFDTGDVVDVVGSGLVGRNPGPAVGETVDQLVPVSDSSRSVSKTHLAFGLRDGGFWVLDRGSTNGTWTVSADGARQEVPRGISVDVPVNTTVEIGDRSFVVRAG